MKWTEAPASCRIYIVLKKGCGTVESSHAHVNVCLEAPRRLCEQNGEETSEAPTQEKKRSRWKEATRRGEDKLGIVHCRRLTNEVYRERKAVAKGLRRYASACVQLRLYI